MGKFVLYVLLVGAAWVFASYSYPGDTLAKPLASMTIPDLSSVLWWGVLVVVGPMAAIKVAFGDHDW
jgi:hypothetical protein